MIIKKTHTKQLIKDVCAKFSPSYYRTHRLLRKTEFLPEESIRAWQFGELKKMLIHAYERVPYYKETFRQAGLDPSDMVQLSDVENFPLLTKKTFRENTDAFISMDTPKNMLFRVYTGGTTGAPLPLYRNPIDFVREKAFSDYVYWMLEMDPRCKSVYMRGQVDDNRGRYHCVGNFGKTLYLSGNNLGDENLALYAELIRKFAPRLFYALPSVVIVLAEFMERKRIAPFEGLLWAFCPSESLYDFQVKLIQRVLGCRVGTFYGHSEHAVLAGRCTKSTLYHVVPQYGYAELVNEDGEPVTEEGMLGEIVGTAFTNPGCPLVRYRTGDYAVYTTTKCPCGRSYQMWKRIEGRGQAVAVAKNGGHVSIGATLLCTLHDRTYGKIKQFGIEQLRVGELTINVVPHESSDILEIREYFKRVFAQQFPRMFDVRVKQFDDAGFSKKTVKHLYFVQHVVL